MLSQTAGRTADTARCLGHFPQHARIAVRATFAVCDRLKEPTGIEVRISIRLRFREDHASSHAMCLEMLHSRTSLLPRGPRGEVVIQLLLMLQATVECGKFF